ncbi:urea transporter [Fredinandcohnia sp. QZ13]|uniref:urea transporter n=1 Tax=Fredinandcohnia sp. QZ13 TaxID=3073144 RepID=UPI002853273E|nr:urea transporter [Fredinandcohnia sp. QZ13]MDR4887825.1 urea transporter [Fredinandcohnia sp. QZ13]
MKNTNHKPRAEGGLFFFLTAALKGISQVMLIENALSGIIILIAITLFSYSLGIIALLSALIATMMGKIGGVEEETTNQGLLGYNSVLTGIALTLFLTGPYDWIFALIGAAVTAIFTATMIHVMKNTGIPVLTFPFIITTWFTLLASYQLKDIHLTSKLVPEDIAYWGLDTSGKINWSEAAFNGIGQIFFIHSTLSGILLIVAVFLAGWKLGLYAVLGNVLALLTSFLLGGEDNPIYMGLYGYNAILTILAVSVVFKTNQNRLALFSGIVATCVTVPLMASITTWLQPFGLPALTMPFVLSTWLFLGARKVMPNL